MNNVTFINPKALGISWRRIPNGAFNKNFNLFNSDRPVKTSRIPRRLIGHMMKNHYGFIPEEEPDALKINFLQRCKEKQNNKLNRKQRRHANN